MEGKRQAVYLESMVTAGTVTVVPRGETTTVVHVQYIHTAARCSVMLLYTQAQCGKTPVVWEDHTDHGSVSAQW